MTRSARRRVVLGIFIVVLAVTGGGIAAYEGLFGPIPQTIAWQAWGQVNVIAEKWYTWIDRFGKLAGFLVTVGSGAYAIYQRLYFAEFNMHLRLKEFQVREEERLKEANKNISKALKRPGPARDFEAPIFTDETLNPVLRRLKWGKRPTADTSLDETLEELNRQLGLWEGTRRNYELRKQQVLLLKGAIAAARAAKSSGEQARNDNLEALGFFQEAFALSGNKDADALEYAGHQQVRLAEYHLALQTFEALAAMYADNGPSLPRARALKFQAEVLECRPQPNLQRANALLIQALNAMPTDARQLEKAEIHEVHGRVRERAGIGLAMQSYTDAERLYHRIVNGRNSSGSDDDVVAAHAGLARVREAQQHIRLAPLNGNDGPGLPAPQTDQDKPAS